MPTMTSWQVSFLTADQADHVIGYRLLPSDLFRLFEGLNKENNHHVSVMCDLVRI